MSFIVQAESLQDDPDKQPIFRELQSRSFVGNYSLLLRYLERRNEGRIDQDDFKQSLLENLHLYYTSLTQSQYRQLLKLYLEDSLLESDIELSLAKFRSYVLALKDRLSLELLNPETLEMDDLTVYRLAVFNLVNDRLKSSDWQNFSITEKSLLGYLLLSSMDLERRNAQTGTAYKILKSVDAQGLEAMYLGFQDSWIYDQVDTSTKERIKWLIEFNFFSQSAAFIVAWEPFLFPDRNLILEEFFAGPDSINKPALLLRLQSAHPENFMRGLRFLEAIFENYESLIVSIETENLDYSEESIARIADSQRQQAMFESFLDSSADIYELLRLKSLYVLHDKESVSGLLEKFNQYFRKKDQALDKLEPEFRANFQSAEQQTQAVLGKLGVCGDLLRNPPEADGKAPQ